ncbi:MAG: serine/threonine protein kinase, partial [Rikenellaceae bacterium]|nr:serine/threonine protein kinase [Rikenellaceae bacterium]
MQLTPGTLLERGKYRIIETLGRGGFGITYLAEQVMAKRKVCIKEFFPKDYYKRDGDTGALTLSSDGFAESMNKFKAKFIKEAQTIATLNHANIIPIHDVFEENGTAYYVMDYIEGESLYDIVKHGGALTEADAVRYIRDTAAALGHIHARQIMHLDVKPGNIMVREEDRRAILIDFGLSKHYDATSGEATSTTPVGVSHGYAPMEQYQDGGVSTFSPETDIYSLGATLYFLVTGNVPPQATVVAEQGLPYLDNLSSNIRNAITKSMSYLRKDRPHTIKDFLALLDNKRPVAAVLADESEKTKITQKPRIQPAVEQPKPKPKTYLERELEHEQKRNRWWMWLLGLLLIGCGAWFIYGDNNTEDVALPEEDVALPETSAPYKVGDYYNENGKEGVVFEVSDDGRHGKIVSL